VEARVVAKGVKLKLPTPVPKLLITWPFKGFVQCIKRFVKLTQKTIRLGFIIARIGNILCLLKLL
jgi:hypothetical protein